MAFNSSEPGGDAFDQGGRGLQHQGLRRSNERAVLTIIGFNAGVSNADIARISGLAPQTVSAILTELDAAGLIMRGPVLRGRRGQPATPLYLKADGALAIGVEISWRHVEVVLVNFHARVVARQFRSHDYPDARTICDVIVGLVDELLAELPEEMKRNIVDLGVAAPKFADALQFTDAPSEQGALWRDLHIAAELAKRTGREVTLFNDGNAACWAELIAYPRPRPANFMYFLVSHYIAAGIVGEGMLWEGPNGHSANLGSMLVRNGKGDMKPAHAVASCAVLEARLAAEGISVKSGDYENWDWNSFGDVLETWLEETAEALAEVIFNANAVIESGLVVIDTAMPREITVRLVEQISQKLAMLPKVANAMPRVATGHLGHLAPAIGAGELPMYRRYFSRSLADLAL